MALFKIYSGTADEFPQDYALHPGYAYFFEDSGELVIDTESGRIDVKAAILVRNNGSEPEFIDVDDVLIADADGVTKNAILVGGDNNTVKAVAIADGSLMVGNTENGVAGLNGTGALYASTLGAPQFGTLPITAGGTGATSAAAARTNLDVYSKKEVGEKVDEVTTLAYTTTLAASNWVASEDLYTYTYTNTELKCGKNGNVPLIISYTSNKDDWSKIDSAEATAEQGIIFTSSKAIEGDIGIVIIDVK